jgi:O-antigen ligase
MPSGSLDSSLAGPPSPGFARYAIAVLALAGIAVMLAAAPYRAFDLDRFFVPKELVLHAAALLLAVPLLWRPGARATTRTDLLLLMFVGVSTVSALFASNLWLATRSLAITWSSMVVFWAAGEAARAGRTRAIVAVASFAVVVAVVTSLLQAYGLDSPYFSSSRVPGGTLGNRNFVAHIAAIGAPLCVVLVIGARQRASVVLSSIALVVVTAALVLSRSRAAWLALGASVIVLLPGVWHARARWHMPGLRGRVRLVALVVAGTVVAALILPNKLEWRSDSPYLDSIRSVVDYKQGSGRGRLVQYTNTLKLALAHPLLGVGPGNWPVRYPTVESRNDPSLDEATGMTANPWPSSDWMAFASERGLIATLALVLALAGMLIAAWRQMRDAASLEDHLQAVALATALIATVIVGLFDAVLLLPAPALLAWAVFGALRPAHISSPGALSRRARLATAGVIVLACAVATTRSALQLRAIAEYNRGALDRAESDDPGNYRIRLRLAEQASARGHCDLVRKHAGAARALFPNAAEPRHLLAGCPTPASR